MESRSSNKSWNIILTAAAVVFFVGTFILTQHGDMYISPDGTANAFFAKQYSETGTLKVFDQINVDFSDGIFPRSIVAKDGHYLPGSFTGLPVLYGSFLYIFGDGILNFITPILAILAVFAFRKIIIKIFNKEIANISALLLFFHPAFWYYSARGLMHNVLFSTLLIFGVYFILITPIKLHLKKHENTIGKIKIWQTKIDLVVSGLFVGLALFVRTSEVYWVIGLTLFLLLVIRKHINKVDIFIFFTGIIIGMLPILLMNNSTYGHPLISGYNVGVTDTGMSSVSVDSSVMSYVFPFGLHLRTAIKHISDYGITLFWWLSIFVFAGIPVALFKTKQSKHHKHLIYTIVFLLLTAWLGFWYGSWVIFDNPDKTQLTIANSYIRYWLPVFIMSIPFISGFIVWISDKSKSIFSKKIFITALVVLLVGLNINITFFNGQDSLKAVSKTLSESVEIKNYTLSISDKDAVIITDRSDKIFFPERRVVYPLRSDKTYELLPELVNKNEVYYYGITLPEVDMEYLNEKKFLDMNLQINKVKEFSKESLYKIYKQ